jgi:dihydrolipoamide dehydrogenase
VTTVSGELHFTRPTQAVVETTDGHARFFEFTDAIIATGSRPTPLSSLPRDGVAVLDSTDALALTAVPTSLAVVGGGYIGLELGTTFAKLGTRVTIVEALDRLLPTLDVALVRPVLTRLRQLGVSVITDTLVEDFDGTALRVRTGGSHQQIKADAVLVAVGRVPNTDELGLDRVGLRAGSNGLLEVGPDRRLSRHVAAIGDITPGPTLAHKASAEALVAAAALSGHIVAYDPMAVPAIVFSDPEIATAGLTQAQAREEGIETLSATFPLAASGRAATLGAKQGFLQVVADRETEAVIGTHIVGPHASELISEGVLAIEMGATLADVAGSIHPHPTLSEQFPEGAHLTLGQPIHFSPSANR